MPYIPAEDRPVLDRAVNALADDIVVKLVSRNGDTDISTIYRNAFLEIGNTIISMEMRSGRRHNTPAERLGAEIFKAGEKYRYNGAWLGELNYSITRLIQAVPRKMVEKSNWKDELRYWLYAQTVGSLVQAVSRFQSINPPARKEWVIDGIVGVLVDIKDEYKRRVNTAYEAVQIKKSGDVYTTPFMTELIDIKNSKGEVVGWQEVMKDRRKKGKKAKTRGE
jgi:hypothetical protein